MHLLLLLCKARNAKGSRTAMGGDNAACLNPAHPLETALLSSGIDEFSLIHFHFLLNVKDSITQSVE